ncbi:MAG: type III pantothenate kinase [Gammaproteobacteria bacterium]|nr:type III pantothenate kinase [Gammaproteobacteria bacterium]
MEPKSNGTVTRKLLIDIGNTNLKWCWLEGGVLSELKLKPHQQGASPDLPQRCWGDEKRPDAVFVANVATPILNKQIAGWIQENWALTPNFLVSEAEAFGVRNAYHKPEQLGVDRWLTLIAVRHRYSVPACIVDSGTAITIDVIKEDGQHLGGLILPGFELMRGALLKNTHIPRVQPIKSTFDLLGRDTESAVASACLNSAAALVERVLHSVAGKLGMHPVVLITGSDAALLSSALTIPTQLQWDLVMSGLSVVAMGKS